jgi:hypothetical protein
LLGFPVNGSVIINQRTKVLLKGFLRGNVIILNEPQLVDQFIAYDGKQREVRQPS